MPVSRRCLEGLRCRACGQGLSMSWWSLRHRARRDVSASVGSASVGPGASGTALLGPRLRGGRWWRPRPVRRRRAEPACGRGPVSLRLSAVRRPGRLGPPQPRAWEPAGRRPGLEEEEKEEEEKEAAAGAADRRRGGAAAPRPR